MNKQKQRLRCVNTRPSQQVHLSYVPFQLYVQVIMIIIIITTSLLIIKLSGQ